MNNRFGLERWVAGPKARWVTLLAWIAAAILLNMLAPPISAKVVNNAAPLADDRPSVQARELAMNEYPNAEDAAALFVWSRHGGLTDTDLRNVQQLAGRLSAQPVPYQTSVPPFHLMSLQELNRMLSEDGSTIVLPLFFNRSAQSNEWKEGVDQAKKKQPPYSAPTRSPSPLTPRTCSQE